MLCTFDRFVVRKGRLDVIRESVPQPETRSHQGASLTGSESCGQAAVADGAGARKARFLHNPAPN